MERMSREEALRLIREADLNTLGQMASARKRELHPENITTFVVDRNINYTNVCWVDCKFCDVFTVMRKKTRRTCSRLNKSEKKSKN